MDKEKRFTAEVAEHAERKAERLIFHWEHF